MNKYVWRPWKHDNKVNLIILKNLKQELEDAEEEFWYSMKGKIYRCNRNGVEKGMSNPALGGIYDGKCLVS